MSTKKLERTVIEGGRGRYNKIERRSSNQEQRATQRDYIARIKQDPESFDQEILEERDKVKKEFNDKLRPMYRWLAKQVGREWNSVRSEISERFNTDTVAGRHVTFDHLLSSIVATRSGRNSRGMIAANRLGSARNPGYFVDAAGILCRGEIYTRPGGNKKQVVSVKEFESAAEWLRGRMIGDSGGVLYWLSCNDGAWESRWCSEIEQTSYGKHVGMPSIKYYHRESGEHKVYVKGIFGIDELSSSCHYWKWIPNPTGFQLRGQLTHSEIERFRKFHHRVKEEILIQGTARLKKKKRK